MSKLQITFFILLTGLLPGFGQNAALKISGKVLETSGKVPVGYATVVAKSLATDRVTGATSSGENGNFELESSEKDIYIEISFIGFHTKKVTDLKPDGGRVDLGTVLLDQDSQVLGEVTVTGQRSQTEFHLDKRVFNVGQDLSSTGASALEVLNNVPSVNVSIQGQISLRGSAGVRILINGKPSVLASDQGNALGSITADMIEKIEVITNPSAKYDAEGTAGIINIVLKKEDKEGINGAVTVNAGVPNNHSVGFSLSRRTEKFNLFTQIGVGYRTFPEKFRTSNESGSAIVTSNGKREKNENFYNLILGSDYHFNATSLISVSGHFGYERETEYAHSNFSSSKENVKVSDWLRHESTKASNPKWEYNAQYVKSYTDHEDHKLLISATGNFFGKDQSSTYLHDVKFGPQIVPDQQAGTDFKEAEYIFKTDYTKPFADKWAIETGAQYIFKDISSDYVVRARNGEQWQVDPNLTNVFEMGQNVAAGYFTGAFEGNKLGVKLGMRLENTDMNTLLITTNEKNKQQYLNLFPSAHTSYKFTDHLSFQAGYSRRIYRPGIWELNPFYNIQNNFRIQTGNPFLQPEFTDSYEVTGIFNSSSSFSTNIGVYHRYTTDAIEYISVVENNISITKPANIGVNKATGVEFNAKYAPVNWFSVSTDFNYNYFIRNGVFETTVFNFSADQWTSRVTSKFKLPAGFDFEIIGHYRSGYRTVQGEITENIFADMGLRKKIFKGKTILNVSVRDAFASRFYENNINQPGFRLYEHSRQGRFVTIGLSYGFGKGEAMEFSGQKMF
jgi:outer membrane receptor protein involved in Fe transport